MNEGIVVVYSNESEESAASLIPLIWAKLESDSAVEPATTRESDLLQMVTYAQAGIPAENHIYDNCAALTVDGEEVTVELEFILWLSAMDLEYHISASLGSLSERQHYEEYVSFDVPFSGSNQESLGYIFNGQVRPTGSGFVTGKGKDIFPNPVITVGATSVRLSASCYCVLRADGKAFGYKYALTIGMDKSTGYKVDGLRSEIRVAWEDEFGEEQIDMIELPVPQCVQDLLEECPDERPVASHLGDDRGIDDDDGRGDYLAYVNTCDGKILAQGWEN